MYFPTLDPLKLNTQIQVLDLKPLESVPKQNFFVRIKMVAISQQL